MAIIFEKVEESPSKNPSVCPICNIKMKKIHMKIHFRSQHKADYEEYENFRHAMEQNSKSSLGKECL